MSSKKEEERNEKIIRGLMKLPPNRRCINCNSVGPQYVCTTFWTFVCLSCSGIHREFTHRVKSVSMAKFTRQEVEALQEGGNQRAREIYLKNWDMTRMRLPDSSNPDRIRDFIRSVYVNKKYAGERSSENTPKDAESLKANESELKRPNSYHSFSQSPPYDYQYEERRYGKNSALAPRRLGSDRGYEGKVPSFLVSPGRLRDHAMFEDRFANESSGSRLSDFSVSSAGEQFRYDTQSPNSQGGYSSPSAHQSNRHPNARPQRTSSSGSFGSFDSNSVPEYTSEKPVQLTSGSQQLVTSPSSQRPPLGSNQFGSRPALVRPAAPVNQPPTQQTTTSTPSDTSIDLFAGFNERNMAGLNRTLSAEPALVGPTASFNVPPAQQSAATTSSDTSIDLFSGFNEQNTAGLYRTISAGPTVMAPTRPASRPAVSTPSDSSVDLFANFDEHNTTGVGTVSSGQSVTSPTGPASTGPATSFNQLPTQQLAASTPDTSLDLFAAFNENNTTGFNGAVSAGQAVTSPTDMGIFSGFNNQPPMEVKDVGWANFDFSQHKQVACFDTSIQSSPVVTSSEKDLTTGMRPVTGQVPVSSASALPQDPLTIAKALPLNQERSQPWNAFGESSSSGMYGANTQVQMSLPQPSMPGLPQVAPGHSAQLSSLAPVGSNEVDKLNTPPAVQLSVQKPMAPVPAQPQLGNQWFANAFDVNNMLPYQGVSQDLVKSDTHSVPVLSSFTGAPSLTQPNPAALQPLQSSSPYGLYAGHAISKELESTNPDYASEPTSVMGAMSAPLQPLQGMPYQAMQSTNPFDFLDDSDLPNNTFMDMSSIQAALPTHSPATDLYSRGAFQSEFYTQNPTSTDASHMPQGDIPQMRYQVPNPQIQNPTPQGYSSLGSNPFA